MSSNSNGVNVIWRMEVCENINKHDNIYVKFHWPLSKILFRFVVTWQYEQFGYNYSSDGEYDGNSCWLLIERIDKYEETITLNGTVSVFTSAEQIQPLNEFISTNFEQRIRKRLGLKSFQNMFGNITLLIQLWNLPEKRINANYYVSSKLIREKCNFKWELDINKSIKVINRKLCYEFNKKVPRKFTTYNKKIKKEITIKLVFENFSVIRKKYRAYINSVCMNATNKYNFFKGKIKIVAIRENGNALNLLDTHFVTETNDYYNLDVGELITNQHLFYPQKGELRITNQHLFHPQKILTLKIFIETLSYLNAEITEVDYLSDTENFSALFKKSNKFRKHLIEGNSSNSLSTSLYGLYKENQFCDVTLCVGEEKFLCHKSVLCARSPVFRAMFDHDMLEKKTNTVPIENMDARCFGIFLNILYTNSLHEVEWNDLFKVYVAADRYDVSEIRNMCSRALLSTPLSNENVCQMLELCNAHPDDDLMKKVKEFFFKHSKEVMKLPDWNALMSRNLQFAAKLMQEIICPEI